MISKKEKTMPNFNLHNNFTAEELPAVTTEYIK